MSQDFLSAYLRVKKTVDDRAINLRVWNQLKDMLQMIDSEQPLRVLEIGGGIGTMLTRMLDDDLLPNCDYCLLDINEVNLRKSPTYLAKWAGERNYQFDKQGRDRFQIKSSERVINLEIAAADVFQFIEARDEKWDLLIAHAVMDIFDPSEAVPRLKAALNPEGLAYLTINYDGLTIFEPQIDPPFEEKLLRLYNQSMDERLIDGKPSGDSQTGRHLFAHLKESGFEILAVGSSDWVVFPRVDKYPHHEADFLDILIDTIYNELNGHPEIDMGELEGWTAERKNQIKRGDLVCIVHQLDFLGQIPR